MASYTAEITQEYRQYVNIVSAILCVVTADAALQLIYGPVKARQENRAWSYDYWRSVHLIVVTALLAFIGYKWYNLLDTLYITLDSKDVAAKVVLDEVIMAPFVITSYIFETVTQSGAIALTILEGTLWTAAADVTVEFYKMTGSHGQMSVVDRWLRSLALSGPAAAVAVVVTVISHCGYTALYGYYNTMSVQHMVAALTLDSVLLVPLILTVYICGTRLAEGCTWRAAHEEWDRKFTQLYYTNLITWLPYHVCFLVLASSHCHSAYANFYAYLWGIHLRQKLDEKLDNFDRALVQAPQLPNMVQPLITTTPTNLNRPIRTSASFETFV